MHYSAPIFGLDKITQKSFKLQIHSKIEPIRVGTAPGLSSSTSMEHANRFPHFDKRKAQLAFFQKFASFFP